MNEQLIQWLTPGDPPIVARDNAKAELAERFPGHEIELLTVFRVDCLGALMESAWEDARMSPLWWFSVRLVWRNTLGTPTEVTQPTQPDT